jgi:hypothetical protein
MKYDRTALGILAGVAGFVSLMILCIGIFFLPPMYRMNAPFLCSGVVEIEMHNYSFGPGHGGNFVEVYCRTGSGTRDREEITFRAVALAWLAFSVIVFVVLVIWLRKSDWLLESGSILKGPKENALAEQWEQQALTDKDTQQRRLYEFNKLKTELKKELDRGHITREEYEERRDNLILKG